MDGQRARFVDPTLDRIPTINRRATPASVRPGLLKPAWAVVLGFGWPLAIMVGASLEPAPAEPAAAAPLLVDVAALALFAALVATAVAAGRRHPSAAIGGVVTGLVASAFTVACPVSGHHVIGAWWYSELSMTLAMLGVSVAALGRRARTVGGG